MDTSSVDQHDDSSLPDSLRDELDLRLAEYERDRSAVVWWEQVRAELLHRNRGGDGSAHERR